MFLWLLLPKGVGFASFGLYAGHWTVSKRVWVGLYLLKYVFNLSLKLILAANGFLKFKKAFQKIGVENLWGSLMHFRLVFEQSFVKHLIKVLYKFVSINRVKGKRVLISL